MPTVVAVRPDGIGTRLLTILYAHRFAEQMGWTFRAHWPSLIDANYRDRDLLSADTLPDYFQGGVLFKDSVKDVWIDEEFALGKRVFQLSAAQSLHGMTRDEVNAHVASYDVFMYDIPEPVQLHQWDRAAEAKAIRVSWKNLNFALDVRKACTAVISQLDMQSSPAIHLRRGDILNMLTDGPFEHLIDAGVVQIFQRYLPFGTVEETVRRDFADAPGLLVCSEDLTLTKRINEAFPDKTVVSAMNVFPVGSNKAALLDIMLLTRSRVIIAPFVSYFSLCASKVSLTKRHPPRLDIEIMLPELIGALDRVAPPDIDARKAIVYTCGYQNLVHSPDTELRAKLRLEAIRHNQLVFAQMTGESAGQQLPA